jgi:hypothetical protein
MKELMIYKGGVRKICNETLLIDSFPIVKGEDCKVSTSRERENRLHINNTKSLTLYNSSRISVVRLNHQGMFTDISKTLLDNKVEIKRPVQQMIGSSSRGSEIYEYKKQFIMMRYIINCTKDQRSYT